MKATSKSREVEMKILELPRRVFLQKMRGIKAKKLAETLMRVRYFDFSDERIKKRKDLLRIRELKHYPSRKKITEVVYKTYRGQKGGCKIFDECEFEVEDKNAFETMTVFFTALGFKTTMYYEKKRTLFVYKDAKFEFDEHPKIPSFLEVEARNEKEVHALVKKLGLEEYERTGETIGELMRRKYSKISLNGLSFGGKV